MFLLPNPVLGLLKWWSVCVDFLVVKENRRRQKLSFCWWWFFVSYSLYRFDSRKWKHQWKDDPPQEGSELDLEGKQERKCFNIICSCKMQSWDSFESLTNNLNSLQRRRQINQTKGYTQDMLLGLSVVIMCVSFQVYIFCHSILSLNHNRMRFITIFITTSRDFDGEREWECDGWWWERGMRGKWTNESWMNETEGDQQEREREKAKTRNILGSNRSWRRIKRKKK